jgi:hypothetical protein
MTEPHRDEHGLHQARENRASVRRSSSALEGALAEASRPDPARWLSGVADALADLAAAFERHIVANEAPGGLLSDMVAQSPRLAHQAEALRRDHDSLTAEIAALSAGVKAVAAGAIDGDQISDVRSRGLGLLHHLSSHRHLGVEIVYEAYFVDIEAAD